MSDSVHLIRIFVFGLFFLHAGVVYGEQADALIEGKGFNLRLDESATGAVAFEGGKVSVVIPPAYSFDQKNFTSLDSIKRFSIASRQVLGAINQAFLAEVAECNWQKHQEPDVFISQGLAMIECGEEVTQRFYDRQAGATRALMAALEHGYRGRNYLPTHLHQNMAMMHLALADGLEQRRQMQDYIRMHRSVAEKFEHSPARVDDSSPIGFRFEDEALQTMAETILLEARRSIPDPITQQAAVQRRVDCFTGTR